MRLNAVWKVFLSYALALSVGWVAETGAQANHPGPAGRSALERPKFQTSVTNLGTQGGSVGAALSRNNSLVYPGIADVDVITGIGWADKLVNFQHDCNGEAALENGSQGEGIGLALRVPESFPVYKSHAKDGFYVVLTGPRSDMLDEVTPMVADPSKDPDLRYLGGEPRVRPESAEQAGRVWREGPPYYYPGTWSGTQTAYQGQPRLIRAPVKINNWQFGKYLTPGPPAAPSSRSDEWPEEIIVSKWTTLPGITFTRRTMAWSYPAWSDFFITELEFENTGDSDGDGKRDLPEATLDGVYVSILNNWMLTDAGLTHYNLSDQWFHFHQNALDDWIVYSENPGYAGPAKGLKMFVDWDGDSPEFPWDDTGDPVNLAIINSLCSTGRKDGEFTSFQYMGMGPLAYQDGGAWSFNSRDMGRYAQPQGNQPSAVRFWRISSESVSEDPRPTAHTRKTMYDLITASGVDPNPTRIGVWFSNQTYGPYTLAPGEKGKLVVAWVAGSPAGEGDLYTWMRSNLKNFAALPQGETWMVDFFKRAKWAYDNEYDLPDAPPDVYARTVNSPNATNQILWNSADDAENPDYVGTPEAKDVKGYRIYKTEWSPDGPWTLIGTAPKGTTTFTDDRSVAGFNYWYSVRTIANGHDKWAGRKGTMVTLPEKVQAQVKAGLEEGQWGQSQRIPPFSSPQQPTVAETEKLSREVYAVPNPFRNRDANLQYPGKTEIRFVNVPSKCWVYIFSTSGDMIAKILHDDRTDNPNRPGAWLGEMQWNQYTLAQGTAEVPAGVYFFVVESLVPESMGQKKSGKFMIIR